MNRDNLNSGVKLDISIKKFSHWWKRFWKQDYCYVLQVYINSPLNLTLIACHINTELRANYHLCSLGYYITYHNYIMPTA